MRALCILRSASLLVRWRIWIFLWLAAAAGAAEKKFDFSQTPQNQTPPGFRSAISGEGKPGDWKVLTAEAPTAFPPFSPKAQSGATETVLAQLSQERIDEHFPLLIYDEETFDDFTLTTRFKMMKGEMEQMAGVAFRLQDERNYYVVRASSLGKTFRFYKVVNGQRGNIIGPEVPIPSGVWHALTIECKGAQIRCLLDNKEIIPTLTDTSFTRGKIAFWTKSDSVTWFADTTIHYRPRELPAQQLARALIKKYPRLIALRIYIRPKPEEAPTLLAGETRNGPADTSETVDPGVFTEGATYYAKSADVVAVSMPVRDRNGEVIAAVRVSLKPVAGQTHQNALARALPIVRDVQAKVQSLDDLE